MADWYLVIAGTEDVGHRRELESLSAKLGIRDRVRFVGPIYETDKRDAFAAADLFVLPSHTEGFGIVVAEALGAGIPVLTTLGTPWQELRTRDCGWWVDVSIPAISDAISDAVHRPKAELAAMGQRGKALIAEKYTWSRAAYQSLRLYAWLLGQGEQPDFVVTD